MPTQLFTTDQEQLTALAAKFDLALHKVREEGGRKLTYLEHTTVADRLRAVFGSGLTIRTGQVIHNPSIDLDSSLLGYVDMEVIIDATFASGRTVTVSGWGEADILATKPKSEQEYRDGRKRGRANQPFKTAYSDGLKVAAARLGVGAYLYTAEGRADVEAEEKRLEEKAREKAALTCQSCGSEITAGIFEGVTYDTAEGYMHAVRKKVRRRWCVACVANPPSN